MQPAARLARAVRSWYWQVRSMSVRITSRLYAACRASIPALHKSVCVTKDFSSKEPGGQDQPRALRRWAWRKGTGLGIECGADRFTSHPLFLALPASSLWDVESL
jgi:hypothetical protein